MSLKARKTTESSEVFDVSGDGGIMKRIIVDGAVGEEVPEDVVAIVHYTGRLLDGTVFDSSVKRGQPFTFNLGRREVILGWDKGVATMRKGEKCILTCKPDYAYGSRGIGPIPGNATLEFEVELLGWREIGKSTFSASSILMFATLIIILGLLIRFFYSKHS